LDRSSWPPGPAVTVWPIAVILPTVQAAVPATIPSALALPVAAALKLEISRVWPPGRAKAMS